MASDRTEAVLNFIRRYFERWGYAPSYRDIGRGCRISSTSNVRYHLDKLQRDGYIERRQGAIRGIRLLEVVDE